MSEMEIIAAVRQLAVDLDDFGVSPITKESARQLLSSSSGSSGGPLNHWLNSLSDNRQKLLGRRLMKLVVQAGYLHWESVIQDAIKELPILCDRLEAMVEPAAPLSDTSVAILSELLALGATADAPQTRETIARRLRWKGDGKRNFNELKSLDYVRSCQHGYYLTEAGIKRAESLM